MRHLERGAELGEAVFGRLAGRDAVARVVLIVAAALVVLMHLWPAVPARAHADADWIAADPRFSWCCSIRDCERVTGRVRQNQDTSWSIAGWQGALMLGQKGLYFSTSDGQPWACRNLDANTLRCLFLPFPDV